MNERKGACPPSRHTHCAELGVVSSIPLDRVLGLSVCLKFFLSGVVFWIVFVKRKSVFVLL